MEHNLEWTKKHPVSNVQWIPIELIHANDYNPNSIATPEMNLLETSISLDGFTQPIVLWQVENEYEVVDGFHRYIIGKKLKFLYLPCVIVNSDRIDRKDRMACTIRHNRARGKHNVIAMSNIVKELVRLGLKDTDIMKQLGMDNDEVLRLKQISGLSELFNDKDFSQAWELEN